LLRDELLGTTEATWGQTLGVRATLTGVTRNTLDAIFKIKDLFIVGNLDDVCSRLILAAVFENSENKDHSDQGENTDQSITVGTVKVVHL
jgi:hypothetical protein